MGPSSCGSLSFTRMSEPVEGLCVLAWGPPALSLSLLPLPASSPPPLLPRLDLLEVAPFISLLCKSWFSRPGIMCRQAEAWGLGDGKDTSYSCVSSVGLCVVSLIISHGRLGGLIC